MIEEEGHLILIVLADQLLQPLVVTELDDVLLLSVLLDNFPAYPAFSGVPIACDCVRRHLPGLNHLLAVGTQHRPRLILLIRRLLLPLLLPALGLTALLICSTPTDSSPLSFRGYNTH